MAIRGIPDVDSGHSVCYSGSLLMVIRGIPDVNSGHSVWQFGILRIIVRGIPYGKSLWDFYKVVVFFYQNINPTGLKLITRLLFRIL